MEEEELDYIDLRQLLATGSKFQGRESGSLACAEQFRKRVKISMAIAIIRSTPDGMTTEQYAKQLCDDYRANPYDYRLKAIRLEEELRHVRQEAFIRAREGPAPTQRTETPSFRRDKYTEQEPPHDSSTINKDILFLQSVVRLIEGTDTTGIAEYGIISDTVRAVAADFPVDLAGVPRTLLQQALVNVSGIVSSKANMDSKLVQEAMQNIVGVVLERVFAQDSFSASEALALSTSNSETPSKAWARDMLLSIAEQSCHVADMILCKCAELIEEFMRHNKRAMDITGCDVVQLENIPYVLSIIDGILERRLYRRESRGSSNGLGRCRAAIEHSIPHARRLGGPYIHIISSVWAKLKAAMSLLDAFPKA